MGKRATLAFPVDVDSVRCTACDMEFVIFAVIRGWADKDDPYVQHPDQFYPQCPGPTQPPLKCPHCGGTCIST